MLSIGVISNSEYYLHLAGQDGYYQGGGLEPVGKWLGKGAAALHLRGDVQAEAFRSLLEGIAPDNTQRLQNAGSHDRQPGWDLTFSADKSVSALWSQADEPTRRQIETAHAEAVRAGVDYLEDVAGWTRRGRGGKTWERAGLIVAAFEHASSRAGDPQLHTHALFTNGCVREDGTLGSIVSRSFYQHKMTAGALYRAQLAYELQVRLGLAVERRGALFHLRGVSERLCREFSKRRIQIEREIQARGIVSAAGAAAVTLATRTKKLPQTRETLRTQWADVGRTCGFGEKQAQALLRKTQRGQSDPRLLFESAVVQIMEGDSHFNERTLLRRAAEAAPGTGVGVADLRAGMQTFLAGNPDVVRVGNDRYSTREMLTLERNLLEKADRLHGAEVRGLPPDIVARAARATEKNASRRQGKPVTLSGEQKEALEHITQRSGGIQLVSGMAGTGKTFFLEAAQEAWKRGGRRVLGAALSGKAAQGLQEGSGIQSATLARLLMDLDNHWLETVGHHLWQLTRAMRGKKTWGPPERMTLDKNTVLVVDEAGMVGTRMLNALLTAVEKAGAKIVLVGDAAQLQSIDAGGAFHALGKRLGATRLTKIVRQRDEWARRAVHQFAWGDALGALREYAQRGLFHIADSRPEAVARLIADWKEHGVTRPQDCLIFTGTRQERDQLNRLAQEERKKAGKLGKLPFRIAGERFYLGDRVKFTQNSKLYGVQNGMLGTLLGLDPIHNVARIQLDAEDSKKRGKVVSIGLSKYNALALGYVTTAHGGQGQTVERAFVMAGGSMQDRELTYVEMSRARGETRLYVDKGTAGEEVTELIQAMKNSRKKEMALAFSSAATSPVTVSVRSKSPPVQPVSQPVQPVPPPVISRTVTMKAKTAPAADREVKAPRVETTAPAPVSAPSQRIRPMRPR